MRIFTELLFPSRCPACDGILLQNEKERGFCNRCQPNILRINNAYCLKCGKQLDYDSKKICKDCENKKHYFTQGRAVYVYAKDMKPAMYRLKYANRRCYAEVFAKEAAEKYGAWIREKGIQAMVPIPMYRKKEKVRGYNQATVIAKALEKKLSLPVLENAVVRVKNSRPQKELNDKERKNNLENAFKIRKNDVKLKKILLIDDIYTTGSTMDAVSRVLLQAGAKEIYCLSVCIGAEKDRDSKRQTKR